MQNHTENSSEIGSGICISVWFLVVPLKLGYSWKMKNCMENSNESSSGICISVWK